MIQYNKNIRVKQHDTTDCGAACLASVSAYYGSIYTIAQIRQMAHTDQLGTNILGLVTAAEKMNLSAKGVKAKAESLIAIPLPAIALVVVRNSLHHFVVIYKVSKKAVTIMDPGDGSLNKISIENFKLMWTGALVIMSPMEHFNAREKQDSVYYRITKLVLPHKSMMFQALLGSIICSVLGLSTSIYIGKITDYVFSGGNNNLLNLLSIIMICIVLVQLFIGIVRSVIAARTGQLINASLLIGYYKHILRLPLSFFDTMRVGEIISRLSDATKITSFINDTALNLIVSMLSLIFTVAFMLIYSPTLTLLTLTCAPLFLLVFFIYNRINKKWQRRIMEKAADLESQLVESLNGIGTLKRFELENFSITKTESNYVKLLRDAFFSQKTSIFINSSLSFFSSIITIVVIWYGSYQVLKNEMTPGSLIMFYSLIGYVTSPIISLVSSNRPIQDAMIAIDRLFEIMDLEIEQNGQGGTEFSPDWMGDIRFENIHFRYGSRKKIFNGLTMTIKHNSFTAIVGESGSGKSTLGSILQRLYNVESGNIYIGDIDISQISNIRKYISSVPQKIELFSGNIIDNIAIGEIYPDVKRINDLLTLLDLRTFVEGLPKGLYTRIGEHGAMLSGGESQRIAIARALYKNPSILILDEATSSLDYISENKIKQAFNSVRLQGRTIIFIAHRLSMVRDADNIIVLNDGKVAEQGSHNQLLSKDGLYARLWKEQA